MGSTTRDLTELPPSVDAPAESTPTASRSTLTVTYRSPDKDGETHHAVIPFSQLYDKAVTDALELLGQYIATPAPKENDVVLKSSVRKNRDGEWIWAEFKPANWLLVVQPGSEVGLFEKQVSKLLASGPVASFWRGPLNLVFGEMKGGLTTWTELNPDYQLLIDRPVSYADAVEATKNCLRDCTFRWIFRNAETRVEEVGKTLSFYLFKTNGRWFPFPSNTKTDVDAWKAFVPESPGVLGVIAT
ncbi:hypothetical protein B0H13DRAFT_1986716 [Mycena leptocephala]|nr:hypothetical protein B0H13DRAFT_1986716 [Mycena leptocephala]